MENIEIGCETVLKASSIKILEASSWAHSLEEEGDSMAAEESIAPADKADQARKGRPAWCTFF